jgi:thioredoxin 1
MKEFSGAIDVVELCTDDLAEIASDCGVISIPTIQLYYRGQLMETIVGCVAKGVLASAVDKVLEDVSVRELREKKSS